MRGGSIRVLLDADMSVKIAFDTNSSEVSDAGEGARINAVFAVDSRPFNSTVNQSPVRQN
jgi:hypothetical protein